MTKKMAHAKKLISPDHISNLPYSPAIRQRIKQKMAAVQTSSEQTASISLIRFMAQRYIKPYTIMAKDVKFNIRLTIDGKEQIVTASTNVRKFAEELEIARTKSTKLRDDLLKITQVGASFQNAFTGLQQLTGVLKTYTSANAVQVEAETKLETVMRQRMNTTDDEIQSIKSLASAQQALGVIGDEVQLMGIQQVATFLKEKGSIDTLVPAMNNLLAQQKGLNATGQDAVNIGSMLGKVMQGQTGALTRAGITFTEAQEKVLKFGTESERAAMLAQVITDNVGEMNAALAKTDAGRAKQLENTIGDLKEQVGALFTGVEPVIVAVGELGLAFTALGTTWQGIRGLAVFTKTLTSTVKASTVVTYGHAAASKIAAAATTLWGNQIRFANRMQTAWTFGAKAFVIKTVAMRAAIMGLMAVTGVGLAIAAVSAIVSAFASKAGEATGKLDGLSEADDAFKRTFSETETALGKRINSLKELIDAKKDTTEAVRKLAGEYPSLVNAQMSALDVYNRLKSASKDYCTQLALEAKANTLKAKMAENAAQIEINAQKKRQLEESGKAKVKLTRTIGTATSGAAMTSEYEGYSRDYQILLDADKDLEEANKKLQEELNTTSAAIESCAKRIKDLGDGNAVVEVSKMTWNEVAEAIEETEKALKGTTDPAKIKELKNYNAQLQQRKKLLDATLGLNTNGYKQNSKQNSKPAEQDSLGWYQERLNDLKKQIETTGDMGLAKKLQAEYRKIEKDFKERKISIGIEEPNKQKIRTYTEELQARLDEAKRELSNAVTVGARVEAEAKIQDIQAEIEEATHGKLSIKAEVEPTYIMQGSDADKRQSYSNARSKADRIKSDYEIGIIGKDEAQREIDDINARLAELGLKPIEIKIEADTEKAKSAFDTLRDGWAGIQGIEGGIQSMTEALEGNGNAWQTVSGIVNGFIELYEGIQTVIGIINLLTGATMGQAAAKTSEGIATEAASAASVATISSNVAATEATIPMIVANKAATASFMELASAEYFAAHAYIPFVGFGIASGFVTAAAAMVQAIAVMPFADGGVVSGPTYALIGEYAGAGNNPEVVAPLDRLRSLIQPQGGFDSGKVEFVIKGRTLAGILAKENNLTKRS